MSSHLLTLACARWLDMSRKIQQRKGVPMKKACLFNLTALLIFLTASCFAQTSNWTVGDWKLDMSASDFGPDPVPQTLMVHILKDSEKLLSWKVTGTDEKGTPIAYSWSGPEDGSMHLVMQDGKEIGKQSAKRNADGSLTRHGEDSDGSSFTATGKVQPTARRLRKQPQKRTKTARNRSCKICLPTFLIRTRANGSSH